MDIQQTPAELVKVLKKLMNNTFATYSKNNTNYIKQFI